MTEEFGGFELYVFTLRREAVHCLGDSGDLREGNGAQGDASMMRR